MSTLIAQKRVDIKQLANLSTPEGSKYWMPVPHHVMIQEVIDQVERSKFELANDPEIGLSHEDARCFFLLNLKSTHSDFCLSIGGRNTHDKKFAMALFGGASVFICSNLQAFGQYGMKTKHTTNVMDRLPNLIADGIREIEIDGQVNDQRIQHFKDFEINDDTKIHDYMIKSMDKQVITNSLIPKVLQDWRNPRHEEFSPRNMWSFNNCFTEIFKEYKNPEQMETRSINLTKVMDEWTLFDKKKVRDSINPEFLSPSHSDGYADNAHRRNLNSSIIINPEKEKAKEEIVVIYNATEEDTAEVTDDELQKIFAEQKKEDKKAKAIKNVKIKPKAKAKKKDDSGLDKILADMKKNKGKKLKVTKTQIA